MSRISRALYSRHSGDGGIQESPIQDPVRWRGDLLHGLVLLLLLLLLGIVTLLLVTSVINGSRRKSTILVRRCPENWGSSDSSLKVPPITSKNTTTPANQLIHNLALAMVVGCVMHCTGGDFFAFLASVQHRIHKYTQTTINSQNIFVR